MHIIGDAILDNAILNYKAAEATYSNFKAAHPEIESFQIDQLNEFNCEIGYQIIQRGDYAKSLMAHGDIVCKRALNLTKQAIEQRPNLACLKSQGKFRRNALSWEYLLEGLMFASTTPTQKSGLTYRRFEQFYFFFIREATNRISERRITHIK